MPVRSFVFSDHNNYLKYDNKTLCAKKCNLNTTRKNKEFNLIFKQTYILTYYSVKFKKSIYVTYINSFY